MARARVAAKCKLLGSRLAPSSRDPRRGLLDETASMGPAQVIWFRQPGESLVRTADGHLYQCDAAR